MRDRKKLMLRAVSDLMITRIRASLGLPFIGSDNTPPGLVNDAYLFGGGKALAVYFASSPVKIETPSHVAAELHAYLQAFKYPSWYPPDFETWSCVCASIDAAAAEFKNIKSPTTHVARLIFQFQFGSCTQVSRDIRLAHLGPILDRFSGVLTYADPNAHPIPFPAEPSERSPHPLGIPLAWEAEYSFSQPVSVTALQQEMRRSYDTELRLDWPMRLPEVEIDNVLCHFSVSARFS